MKPTYEEIIAQIPKHLLDVPCLQISEYGAVVFELRDGKDNLGEWIKMEEHKRIVKELEAEPPTLEWIGVKDRFPEHPGCYRAYVKNKEGFKSIVWAYFSSDEKWIVDVMGQSEVTHWTPLPDPPTAAPTPEESSHD